MKPVAAKRQRCAIYTRKSTEHNLDLAFNSLDAQREACEAYIKSQAHEGWTLVPTAFDDGGLSGASLDRPALQLLLDAVRAKKIDIIVVYKVDRLTRSLADFAKLVELFDEHEVSFVSVTQSFNTTSSMGRLTLNVLLSFAQFEREVIGERVRDKIAASKRKGIWVGGPVPLGYRSVDKKLEIVPEEADLVRKIFATYRELGSIAGLAATLNAQGLTPKPRSLANGRIRQAAFYRVGPLAHLLKNRFYIGEVVYRGEVHPGEHEPILDRELFEAVQEKIKAGAVERSAIRSKSPSILIGRLFDDRGHPMTSTHANKNGVRYRYYTSQALLQGRKTEAGSVARVSGPDIEQAILAAVPAHCLESPPSKMSDREVVQRHVARAAITGECIELTLQHAAIESDTQQTIRIPFITPTPMRKGITHNAASQGTIDDQTRTTLLTAIARSKAWVDAVSSGRADSFDDIAKTEQLAERHIRFLAPLAYLSPRIIEAIADGRAPSGLTVSQLARTLPMSWAAQEQMLLR
jgi:site-specific DNA recombinase